MFPVSRNHSNQMMKNPFRGSPCSLQDLGTFSSSQVGEGNGGATEGYEEDEKIGFKRGKGIDEYRKGREAEVRVWKGKGGGSEGGKVNRE